MKSADFGASTGDDTDQPEVSRPESGQDTPQRSTLQYDAFISYSRATSRWPTSSNAISRHSRCRETSASGWAGDTSTFPGHQRPDRQPPGNGPRAETPTVPHPGRVVLPCCARLPIRRPGDRPIRTTPRRRTHRPNNGRRRTQQRSDSRRRRLGVPGCARRGARQRTPRDGPSQAWEVKGRKAKLARGSPWVQLVADIVGATTDELTDRIAKAERRRLQ